MLRSSCYIFKKYTIFTHSSFVYLEASNKSLIFFRFKVNNEMGRQSDIIDKITFRQTALEGLCPPREQPICLPASDRFRTHDGTCNNKKRPRWGSSQMPFNRFLPPQCKYLFTYCSYIIF